MLTVAVYLAIYAGLLIFFAGCLKRIIQYANTPLHLRWELYPLPHEHPYRAAYGGSYFETLDWWRKPQVAHHRGDVLFLAEEVIFLKSLRDYNRKLWLPSLMFHFGLYLAIVATVCAAAISAAGLFFTGSAVVGIVAIVAPLVKFSGVAAAAFIVAGALWLLVHRMVDSGMKNSTHAGDIFNLLFFIAAFSLLIGGYLMRAPGTASLGEFARGVVDFDRSLRLGPIFAAGAILSAVLVAYIPFTHMAHFIAKYFTWHSVRWDDLRNDRGSAIEGKIAAALNYKPTWSAPHMGADGKRTWGEIAAIKPTAVNPTEEKQK